MRWALSGVPGTGKTAIADALASRIRVIHLGALARDAGLLGERDEERSGAFVVDLDALAGALERAAPRRGDSALVEGHYAHELDPDAVVLLRCDPTVLLRRLAERGWSEAKVRENVEAEALDVLAAEVLDAGVPAREVDTTRLSVDEAAARVWDIVEARPEGFKGEPVGTARWALESRPWFSSATGRAGTRRSRPLR
jgi:adenylate kinase